MKADKGDHSNEQQQRWMVMMDCDSKGNNDNGWGRQQWWMKVDKATTTMDSKDGGQMPMKATMIMAEKRITAMDGNDER